MDRRTDLGKSSPKESGRTLIEHTTADTRIHGTVRQQVRTLFEAERPALQALPESLFPCRVFIERYRSIFDLVAGLPQRRGARAAQAPHARLPQARPGQVREQTFTKLTVDKIYRVVKDEIDIQVVNYSSPTQ